MFSDRGASTTSEFEWARELKIQRNEDICRGLGFCSRKLLKQSVIVYVRRDYVLRSWCFNNK